MGLLKRVANRMSRGAGVPNRNQNRSLMMGPPLLGPPPGVEHPPIFNQAEFAGGPPVANTSSKKQNAKSTLDALYRGHNLERVNSGPSYKKTNANPSGTHPTDPRYRKLEEQAYGPE
jgi:hypothetical protein